VQILTPNDANLLQLAGKFDRLINIPASIDPVRRRNAPFRMLRAERIMHLALKLGVTRNFSDED
jgi:hypothetical protein